MTALLIIADAALLAALVLICSHRKRMHGLERSTSELAGGCLAIRHGTGRPDDIGRLASNIDHLTGRLQRSSHLQRALMIGMSRRNKTFLTILRSDLGGLRKGIPIGDEALAAILVEADRLNKLTEQLENLSLAESTAPSTALDLRHILTETARWKSGRLGETKLAISLDLPSDPVVLHGNERHLHYLAQNLLENSLRYTAAGGRAWIRCTQLEERAMISFDDSVPRARRHRLDEFINSPHDAAGESYELGLLICQSIAEAHGGNVSFATSSLGGLSVTVWLPLCRHGP